MRRFFNWLILERTTLVRELRAEIERLRIERNNLKARAHALHL